MSDGNTQARGGAVVVMHVADDIATDPDDGQWVTAERFAAARSEWAAHARALRAQLESATARAVVAEDEILELSKTLALAHGVRL